MADKQIDFYKGTGAAPEMPRRIETRILSDAAFQRQTSPENYRLVGGAGDDAAGLRVVRAVNTALALRMPLLISGEPGSGKTQLGYALAHELGRPVPFKFNTKSTSLARDIFYTYDAVRHFQASQALGKAGEARSDVRDYIDYAPLGLAILAALPMEERAKFLSARLLQPSDADAGLTPERLAMISLLRSPEPQQCVVVIDEIDKAPRDFPNDLLHEMENMSFRVMELGGLETPAIAPIHRPIVLITTNSERQLPDAFLRRCAYVHLDYPRGEALKNILTARLGELYANSGSKFLDDIQNFYEHIRQRNILNKAPGTAELLQFLQVMAELGIDRNQGIAPQLDTVKSGISLLGKMKDDQDRIATSLEEWASGNRD